MIRPSDFLEASTDTFTTDRKFFDDLITHPGGSVFLELWIWHKWLRQNLRIVSDNLNDIVRSSHATGRDLELFPVLLISVQRSLGSVMFLLTRGAIHEAGVSGRQLIEALGIIAHVCRDPDKIAVLGESPLSQKYKTRLVGGDKDEQRDCKKRGIKCRFSALGSDRSAKQAHELFGVLGKYFIHVDSPGWTAMQHLHRTKHECVYLNRSVDLAAEVLPLCRSLLTIVAIELMFLVESRREDSKVREAFEQLLSEDARKYFGVEPLD